MIATAEWIDTTPAHRILNILTTEGHEALYVGGCVRDTLMGLEPKDIDIATSCHPEDVTILMEHQGFNVIPTGIKHGTVSVVVDGETFEVTTYRKDVTTDGRNATVAFTSDMKEDAMRRDFTVNALYMQANGVVLDSSGTGIEDIMHRRIRFVGDAEARCKEDYLRILRYFRFYAKFGGGVPDTGALNAVAQHWHKVFSEVSAERTMMEIRSILSLPNPVPALELMESLRMLQELVGTRSYADPFWLHNLIRAEQHAGVSPDWRRRYTFLSRGATPVFIHSNAEGDHIRLAHLSTPIGDSPAMITFEYKNPNVAMDAHLLRRASMARTPEPRAWIDAEIMRGMEAKLPVDGPAFFDHGIGPGPELGKLLRIAKDAFKDSDLTATSAQLVESVLRTSRVSYVKESLA